VRTAIARLLLIGISTLVGALTYAVVALIVAFGGCLALQRTAARDDFDVPRRFSEINFLNNRFVRALGIVGSVSIGLVILVATVSAEGRLGVAFVASFGGLALAQAVILTIPGLLKSKVYQS